MRFRKSAATGAFQRRRSNYGTSSEIWGFHFLWKIDPCPKNISKINLLALIVVIGLCSGGFCVLTSMYRLFLYMEIIQRWLWQVFLLCVTFHGSSISLYGNHSKMIVAGITTRGGSWPRLTGNVWSTRWKYATISQIYLVQSSVLFSWQIVSDIFLFCSLLMCRKEATLWRWTAILLLPDHHCKDFQSQHQEDLQHQEDF